MKYHSLGHEIMGTLWSFEAKDCEMICFAWSWILHESLPTNRFDYPVSLLHAAIFLHVELQLLVTGFHHMEATVPRLSVQHRLRHIPVLGPKPWTRRLETRRA